MRKIFIAVLAVLLMGWGMAYALPATNNSGPGDILGQGKLDSQPHKIFRLVRFVPTSGSDNSIGLTVDTIVVWDTVSDDGVTVTTTATSGDNAVAGILVATTLTPDFGTLGNTAAADTGKRNWTWLQTYGYAKVIAANFLTCAVGDMISTSTVPGQASTFTLSTTQSGSARGAAGFALDATSVSVSPAELEVFLRGLD